MPTYDYQCNGCYWIEEKRHRMTEEPEYTCPACNSPEPMKRIILQAPIFDKSASCTMNPYQET